MNILIISCTKMSNIGGGETYNRTLCECFSNEHKFYELYYYENAHSKDVNKNHAIESIWMGVKPIEKCNYIKKILAYRKISKKRKEKIIEIVKQYNIDVIINSEVHNFSSKKIGVPIIDVQHRDDKFYRELYYPNILTFLKRIITKNKWWKNKFVTFTENSKNNILKTKDRNIVIADIPIGIFTKNEIKKIKDISKDKKYISYIGRISKEKNIDFLNEISNQLNNDGYQIEFYGGKLSKDQLNQSNFHGEISSDEIKKILLKTKVLILASESEGFPICIVEALSYGVPCVVLDSFSNASFLIDDSRGRLIKNKSVEEFKDSILYLLRDKDYYKKEKNCFDFAMKNLSLDEFKKKWDVVFKEIENKI